MYTEAETWVWILVTTGVLAVPSIVIWRAELTKNTKHVAGCILVFTGVSVMFFLLLHTGPDADDRSSSHSMTTVFSEVRTLVSETVYPLLPLPILQILAPVAFLVLKECGNYYRVYDEVPGDKEILRAAAIEQSKVLGWLFSVVVTSYVLLSAIARVSSSNAPVMLSLASSVLFATGFAIQDAMKSGLGCGIINLVTPTVPGCLVETNPAAAGRIPSLVVVHVGLFFTTCKSNVDKTDRTWTFIPNSGFVRQTFQVTLPPSRARIQAG